MSEWCRECRDERDERPYDEREAFQIKPAEFILWGKLLPPEALGPRCYDHAAKHIGHHGLQRNSGWALYDLRRESPEDAFERGVERGKRVQLAADVEALRETQDTFVCGSDTAAAFLERTFGAGAEPQCGVCGAPEPGLMHNPIHHPDDALHGPYVPCTNPQCPVLDRSAPTPEKPEMTRWERKQIKGMESRSAPTGQET